MALELRPLTEADDAASWQLGRVAFGGPPERPAGRRPTPAPGEHALGAFDGGRLVGTAVDLEHTYYYGGRAVAGSGVAGVAIAPEFRGGGILRDLLGPLMARARDRGAAISALFPTTAVPYRRLGWELTGVLRWTSLPTAALAGERRPAQVRVRPAEQTDVPAVLECYRTWAEEGTGMLGRVGALFDREPADLLTGHDGYSVADGPDGIEGYASWDRDGGYDAGGVLAVPDLVATTPRALTALLAMLATWRSVAPILHLRLRPDDPAWLLAGLAGATTLSEQPWMLRLIDAPAAVAARGWSAGVDGNVDLELVDDLCPWNAGPHQLAVKAGAGTLSPGGSGSVRVEPGALAALYAGATTPAVLRRAGLLAGGDPDTDAFLTAALAGPPPGLLDYF
ncbi:GNAT family N-acetyltransferase [Sporichthya sp.]|uniref:GNAT family N-acetyltransferase n=1 Tax=Sporichthya sp. TaxID=65475 RepID=UPI0017E4A8E5|nr:GNAT family N-acetyltransferase [Sporichthya sp.]MBA3745728.1 GNAT family N-acetyltransferase [Sporichthya sp.]